MVPLPSLSQSSRAHPNSWITGAMKIAGSASAVIIIEPHLVRSIVTYLCFSLMTFRYSAPRPVILGALVISGIVIFKHLVKFEKEPVSIRLIRRNR